MIEIANIIPTHNEIREPRSVGSFVRFLREGRLYRAQKRPITINRFEDGTLYARDGHRRISAAVLTDVKVLLEGEYTIEEFPYANYKKPNIHNGWFTPFDPVEQCRLANFADFKEEVLAIYDSIRSTAEFPIPVNYDPVIEFIEKNANRYREPRRVHSFEQLVAENFEHDFEDTL